MSIIYHRGDLIRAAVMRDVDTIAHQCNCFCNMGRGIAPKIAEAFPQARIADNLTTNGDVNKLGKFSVAEADNGLLVFNLYGQYGHWKRSDGKINTDYIALKESLDGMARYLIKAGRANDYIGLPKLGCGLGGGDWSIVEELINDSLRNFRVLVYTL